MPVRVRVPFCLFDEDALAFKCTAEGADLSNWDVPHSGHCNSRFS